MNNCFHTLRIFMKLKLYKYKDFCTVPWHVLAKNCKTSSGFWRTVFPTWVSSANVVMLLYTVADYVMLLGLITFDKSLKWNCIDNSNATQHASSITVYIPVYIIINKSNKWVARKHQLPMIPIYVYLPTYLPTSTYLP